MVSQIRGLEKRVQIGKQALLHAGRHILNLFGKSMDELGTEYKAGDGDTPRTLIDTHSEKDIRAYVQDSGAFQGFSFYGEEAGGVLTGRDIIVDPYDGTSNAQIKLGMSTSGMCLFEEGGLVASIILHPFKRKLFGAMKGGGAYVNNVVVRRKKSGDHRLSESSDGPVQIHTDTESNSAKTRYAWVDALFNDKTTGRKNAWIAGMVEAGLIRNVRMTGSNIGYSAEIAEGGGHYQLTDAVGGFYDLAGYNLIEEAGGRMVNLEGVEPTKRDQVVIAVANPADLDKVLEILEELTENIRDLGNMTLEEFEANERRILDEIEVKGARARESGLVCGVPNEPMLGYLVYLRFCRDDLECGIEEFSRRINSAVDGRSLIYTADNVHQTIGDFIVKEDSDRRAFPFSGILDSLVHAGPVSMFNGFVSGNDSVILEPSNVDCGSYELIEQMASYNYGGVFNLRRVG